MGYEPRPSVSDGSDNKPRPVGGAQDQLGGPGCPQQNAQLLLTPASLQLAQLQAQLTLHRLKLAQSAVGGNANAAAAASVLNQVLTNVAMSQPLFNQLRASAMVGNAQAVGGGFHSFQPPPPPPLPPNAAMGTLVGSGFNQNHSNVRLNHYGGGGVSGNQAQQANQHGTSEYGKTSEIDRYPQYGFLEATSVASSNAGDGQGQYVPVVTQAQSTNQGFQMDFYGQNDQSRQQQQGGFCDGNQNGANMNAFKEQQWKSPATVKPFRARGELYNPEEPTSDPKFNAGARGVTTSSFAAAAGGAQGFLGYHKQPLHGAEETPSTGVSLQLHPHQLDDYHAVTPSHLPHQCTICEKKVYNLKDWDQHVKGKLHLQNRSLYSEGAATAAGAVQYGPAGASEGCLNPLGVNNSMAYSAAANQDVLSGANQNMYLPAAAMTTYPMPGAGFNQLPPGSKTFPPRKSVPGRVVHICNLPEGSCTENDVINLGLPFGKVTNYILMRSTHQAFLEMAYIEAAQAMVQYYQLTPATINDQKLLIRMSKRYKELQLKKPGKDVDTIIQDINSQREWDDMQEVDHYMPERARSRSPISRSLSPRSHSPSFTSCSSAHSPPGAPCRGGPERGCSNGGPGLGPRRGSWDWTPQQHVRRGDEERDREEASWRNGGPADDDRSNVRMQDRRNKTYPKPTDRISPRSVEERGGGGEGMRGGNRGGDWYPQPRSSPQGVPHFPPYRNTDEEFYKKGHAHKSEMPMRSQYERHEEGRTKMPRRDGSDHHSRTGVLHRHPESQPPPTRTAENRRQDGGRSKKTTGRRGLEKPEKESAGRNGAAADKQKEKSASPDPSGKREGDKGVDEKEDWESGEDTEGECWYPKNMEELVTVDEVGEDDSIVEPDLPELQEHDDPAVSVRDPTVGSVEVLVEVEEVVTEAPRTASDSRPRSEIESAPREETESGPGCGVAGLGDPMDSEEKAEDILTFPSPKTSPPPPLPPPLPPSVVASETPSSNLNDFPNQEFKAALDETCLSGRTPTQQTLTDHADACESNETQEVKHKMEDVEKQVPPAETDHRNTHPEADTLTRVAQNSTHVTSPLHQLDTKAYSPSTEQEKAISEHSIPLGVEFIVPRTGFYCKLCGLFYTCEETAKTSHCRSTVHYRNLQKYLSQLAEESLLDVFTDPAATE